MKIWTGTENSSRMLSVLIVMFISTIQLTESGCVFPTQIRGKWYDGQVGHVTIRKRAFSGKGSCHETLNNYYVTEDRDYRCYRCIEIFWRNKNLIQYQQSRDCTGSNSLREICSQIDRTVTHTLVKVNADAMPCPFQAGYHMKYTNKTGGLCYYPQSYAKPCATDGAMTFNFKHCPNTGYTYNQDWLMECVALWQDKESFLYMRLVSEENPAKTEYRCAVYINFVSSIYMAMSTDATCRGLVSPQNGPVTMELTRDLDRWYDTDCKFPQWLGSGVWRDLSGRREYTSRRDVTEMHVRSRHLGTQEQITYRCIRANSITSPDSTEFTVVSFTSKGCSAERQCLRIKKINKEVLLVEEGDTGDWRLNYCETSHFNNSKSTLIFLTDGRPVTCPIDKSHHAMDQDRDCYISGNCHNKNLVSISKQCSSHLAGFRGECLLHWKDQQSEFVILQKDHKKSREAFCFELVRTPSTTTLIHNDLCQSGRGRDTRRSIQFFNYAESCLRETRQITTTTVTYRKRDKDYKKKLKSTSTENHILYTPIPPSRGPVTVSYFSSKNTSNIAVTVTACSSFVYSIGTCLLVYLFLRNVC